MAKVSLSIADGSAHLLSGASWTDPGQPLTITYSFEADVPNPMPDGVSGFAQFNAAQIQGAQLALEAWSDVANIHFVRIGSGTSGPDAYSDAGTIRFSDYTSGEDGSAAFTYLLGRPADRSPESFQGDGFYNSSLSYIATPTVFGYGQQVLVHEIGHALGLSHPSDYNANPDATPTYSQDASFAQDDRQYTVMSYFSETNTGAYYGGAYAAAPQLLDIAAIQQLYGANTTAFLGDTTYGFNSNADRPWFLATSATSPVVFTVWDAGGDDTFDFSGYGAAQTIDLNPRQFSSVGGLTGNVAIAVGTTIENAIGGSGADTILGNSADNVLHGMGGNDSLSGGSGNDTLSGDLGSDTMSGGAGRDFFVFQPGGGEDVIADLDGAEGDRIVVGVGTDGFQLAGLAMGQTSPVVVDAWASWNNITGAQVIRWDGDHTAVDSAARVGGLLAAMPGGGGGVFVIGYQADDTHLALYYDADPTSGAPAQLVASFTNLTDPNALAAEDFALNGPGAGGGDTSAGGGTGALTGTAGDDSFALSANASTTITGFDAQGTDALALPIGSGGFALRDLVSGQTSPVVVDAWASWNNITGAQVIRWDGDHTAADSAGQVGGLVAAMPGNGGAGGVFVIGYQADDIHLALYYDADPASGAPAQLVADFTDLTDPNALQAEDFVLGASNSGGDTSGGGAGTDTLGGSAILTGTSGNDVFMLSATTPETLVGFGAAGADVIGVQTGAGGFQLADFTAGQVSLTLVDAFAWWNGISGAQAIRWQGDPGAVDSAAKVDALLQAMPGNGGGGVLFIGYAADDQHAAIYYDADPAHPGGASLVATFADVTSPSGLGVSSFELFS